MDDFLNNFGGGEPPTTGHLSNRALSGNNNFLYNSGSSNQFHPGAIVPLGGSNSTAKNGSNQN